MSWRDFERLVGEVFRRRGFKVTGFAGNGPDGGVDLGLAKDGKRFLVQCKHWKRQVGVTVVRELNGIISAQRAHGGFVVTDGEFTREAREFAKSCDVELIDGNALQELTREGAPVAEAVIPVLATTKGPTPACPKCGFTMLRREATRGNFVGQPFWGCRAYPKCTGILPIS